jgi:2-dehydropantoate 2-reductase
MRAFAVVGPGGVGGLLGAVLARAGNEVVYVARPETAAVLNADGISLTSAQFGAFHVPAHAVPALERPVDACIFAVKANHLPAALDAVPPDVLGGGLVLPLLNGVEHMVALRERYPTAQVLAGAIRVETTRVAPGRIEHTSPFSGIDVASATAPRARVEAIADRLRQAGFDVVVRDDETALLWDKLAFLAPLALLTTHAGAQIGTVRDTRRADLDEVVGEIVQVARAAGASVAESTIKSMFARVPGSLKSSMLRDAEAGRPIELDAIGEAVLRAAHRHGIAVPATTLLVEALRSR